MPKVPKIKASLRSIINKFKKTFGLEVVSKSRVVFEGPPEADRFGLKAESASGGLVREHFKPNRNAAIGHKMGF